MAESKLENSEQPTYDSFSEEKITTLDEYLDNHDFDDYESLINADFEEWIKKTTPIRREQLITKLSNDDEFWSPDLAQGIEIIKKIIDAGGSANNIKLMCRILNWFGKGTVARDLYFYLIEKGFEVTIENGDELANALLSGEQMDNSDEDTLAGEEIIKDLNERIVDSSGVLDIDN